MTTQNTPTRPTARVLKFRRKTPLTLEALFDAIILDPDTPTPPLEELLLMLKPGKRAVAQLAKYRAKRDAVNF